MPTVPSPAIAEIAGSKPYSSRSAVRPMVLPFLGMIDPVLVSDPVKFTFDGSIGRKQAQAIWTWVARDLCTDLMSFDRVESGEMTADELEPLMPNVLSRIRDAVAEAGSNGEYARRLRTQLGGDDSFERLPVVINALRARGLLAKAQAFGKSTNAIPDEVALGVALQSMPLQDSAVAALLLQAAIGQVTNPGRLIAAMVRLVGNGTETSIVRAGFGPLVDGFLAHAQNQLVALQPMGAFADIDLTCRGLDRYHRLMRSVGGYVELTRSGRWATVIAALTKAVSERIEPRLREVVPDMNQSLRKGRDGFDRLDDDRLLSALNGIYLLATIRDCKDSLAVNTLFDQAWSQSGQALELHLNSNLELLRQNPNNRIVSKRLDVGIKMAEVRFNQEYADTLRRARTAAEHWA